MGAWGAWGLEALSSTMTPTAMSAGFGSGGASGGASARSHAAAAANCKEPEVHTFKLQQQDTARARGRWYLQSAKHVRGSDPPIYR